MDKKIKALCLFFFPLLLHAQQQEEKNEAFTIQRSAIGIGGLWKTNDRYVTDYIRKGRSFGEVTIRYLKADGAPDSLKINSRASAGDTVPLQLTQNFKLDGPRLTWTITLNNTSSTPLIIEDLALPLAYNTGGGENPTEIFEQRVVKHHFISGNNSFLYWERPTGVGPYLVMLPTPGTSLEYFSTNTPGEGGRGTFQAFIHSAHTGNADKKGNWRQAFTALVLQPGAQKQYQFVFRWAADYQGIRDLLVEEGGIDVQVMPGMTIPTDLDAAIALRTRQPITSITGEFPSSTHVQKENAKGIYHIKLSHLGENMLTIEYGDHYKTYLEFFVTEPLETLYKKRAAFIVNRQQHKDPTKWYDGLFGVYDMKNHLLRGPDNPDYFDTSRLSYVLTCDDPGLCKAPFVAAKNVFYPDEHEIDAVEYYIQHFVWGGLQRTDAETPYPYGVYGTPNWKVNRNASDRRARLDANGDTSGQSRFKMHTWRSYDYPHIMMMYYSMYQVAKNNPGRTHYLDAKGYLVRAKETAKAFFKYPYEILPWYETYKWGCYNELLLVPLMADLEKEGYTEDAQFLRSEWEKKVKYFIYDDPYPFRSEYAIDATAFESTQALARYAVLNTMQPDSNLWYDKNLKRWYSHPHIGKGDASKFMDRQLAANIALRGAIEPAYYYLGSDYRGRSDGFTLTYMSQMGGWSILDYGLHFAEKPADYLRLGYASYLSAFALINSGTAATNYGFWYPGKDNDGASGWAFESQQHARTWIQKDQGRGPWFYDGEVDLGYGGATRSAATIVTDDPVFGWAAYGGHLVSGGTRLSVIPRDGLGVRLYIRSKEHQIDIELQQDGFAREKPVVFDQTSGNLSFSIENRSGLAHTTSVLINGALYTLSLPAGSSLTSFNKKIHPPK
jgi:hypothetical protein